MSLFIQLYLDEDVDVLVADLLRARGFEATTTRDAGRTGATDAEQLAFAVERRLALLSHTRRDFEKLASSYARDGERYHGLILAARRSPYDLARRVLTILDNVTAEEMENLIRYV